VLCHTRRLCVTRRVATHSWITCQLPTALLNTTKAILGDLNGKAAEWHRCTRPTR
jgi:hypothetical protein